MRAESFRIYPELNGRYVRLVPLHRNHCDALVEAAQAPEVRQYLLEPPGTTSESMRSHIEILIHRWNEGTDLPFTTLRAVDGLPIGMTRYLAIERANDSVEIGGTWLDRRYWRTPFNTESKYLLLKHAFETEQAHRVWLRTDARNERSQRAIERIGGVREAMLREHLRLPSGEYRTSVYYGILSAEWSGVRQHLEAKLALPWSPG